MTARVSRLFTGRGRKAVTAKVLLVVAMGGLFALTPVNPAAAAPHCNNWTSFQGAWVPSAGTNATCEMGQNSNSPAVWQLQRSLNLCYGKGLVVDSDFGPKTRAALVAVQKQHGISADGIYGPQTRGAMWHEGISGGCVQTS